MKLDKMPFNEIVRGEKTVELRLFDEKRQKIKVGDTLCFEHRTECGRAVFCRVTGIFKYPSFKELYGDIPSSKYGHSGEDMNRYYLPEEQKRYGVVGIEFIIDRVKNEIYSARDDEYREFTAALLPSVEKERIVGVRIPLLRKYSQALIKEKRAADFIKDLQSHELFEEFAIHGFILEAEKDFNACVLAMEEFLPLVDNWAVCDSTNPKVFKKNKEALEGHVKRWISSDREYTVRYGIKMLMDHYLGESLEKRYPEMVADVKSDKYYVNMMRAWYFATALAKNWETVIPFIQEFKLDVWTHNKTVQKAIESRRLSPEQKEYLKTLRIRKA